VTVLPHLRRKTFANTISQLFDDVAGKQPIMVDPRLKSTAVDQFVINAQIQQQLFQYSLNCFEPLDEDELYTECTFLSLQNCQ
jgi:hypothetical protein